MIKRIFLLALALGSMFAAQAQELSEYDRELMKMFQVSGMENTYTGLLETLMKMQAEQYLEVPQEIWTELNNEFLKYGIRELTVMLSPVYQKHLSLSDLRSITGFYTSAPGKKLAEATPGIMQESMLIGQQWGQKIGEEFARKLEARGY
ncbi:DUF2059 domain-containing protein [Robertkochia flava]|uniref:DUF2059 domain-containing protein n=1 Tax=Robertkochia flava TaxID=3447986 RepID=UPI001CC9DE97|nr:DUF2059 domain-containing protein [Robertkochia marina]